MPLPFNGISAAIRTQLNRIRGVERTQSGVHAVYLNNGRVPWSDGYSRFRNAAIVENLKSPDMMELFRTNAQLPADYCFRLDERSVEIPWIRARVDKPEKLLDAGCAYFKYGAIREAYGADTTVTLLTLDKRDMNFDLPSANVERVEADMRAMPSADASYDTIVCISTLEHVGLDNTALYTNDELFSEAKDSDYLQAFRELIRVLKPGGQLLVTVPYGKHISHGWLQVMNAEMLDLFQSQDGITTEEEVIYQHGKTGWQVSDRDLAKDAIYYDIHDDDAIAPAKSAFAAAEAVACMRYVRR